MTSRAASKSFHYFTCYCALSVYLRVCFSFPRASALFLARKLVYSFARIVPAHPIAQVFFLFLRDSEASACGALTLRLFVGTAFWDAYLLQTYLFLLRHLSRASSSTREGKN